jgi:hypothetical protein
MRDFPGLDRVQLASLCRHGGAAAAREQLLRKEPSTPIPLPPLTGEFAAMFTSITGKPA